MNHKRLECIKATWMVNGLGPRNRVQHLPYNMTPLSDIQQFVQFVLRYAEENAILLPGRIPGYKRDDIQLLPSSTTKHNIGSYTTALPRSRKGHVQFVTLSFVGCGNSSLHKSL